MAATKLFKKYEAILNSHVMTEGQILSFKKMLNGYSNVNITKDEIEELLDILENDEIKITPEQTTKGIAWLRNQWQTPRGIERKNNPFGYREEAAIENFKSFTLEYFHDLANNYQRSLDLHNYVPIYAVHGTDGEYFEYYVQGGTCQIIG